MPLALFTMPQLGESIAEATVLRWLVRPGDEVAAGQDVMEVETNKATMMVAAPFEGRVAELLAREGESYPVGCLLGRLEVAEGVDAEAAAAPIPEPPRPSGLPAAPAAVPKVEPTVRGLPVPVHAQGATYLSPRMKVRMADLGLNAADLAGLPGSGAGGRVTIVDFEKFVAGLEAARTTGASTMRVAVADAMRRSWTRPLATVGMSVNLEPLLEHRRRSEPKPGPALYAIRALALALAENSAPAGRLIGAKIVHPGSIDVGFAVEVEDGVLVPVLRRADKRPLGDLVLSYNELVELARQRRLPREASGGSIATVTNYGTFGLTWATPIPLPEQTLVLGLGAGRKMPQWDVAKGQFVPVMEAQLTLSFDHRVLDGGGAGRLLTRVAALLQKPGAL
ncbi:MAG: dihydrolipoamide acetyltransferase family protein [Limisphaerales bacterium]